MKISKERNKKRYIRYKVDRDYLKWYRVVRRYTEIRYGLSPSDLELLMYLYSEDFFNFYKFTDYCNMLGWDKGRFSRFVNQGYIHMWRDKVGSEHRLYELTRQGRHIVTRMYKMLNMEEEIPETPQKNPVFKKSAKFSEKTLAIGIQTFNEEVRKKKRGY